MSAPYRLLGPRERVRYWRGHAGRGIPAAVTLVLAALMTVPLFVSVPVMPHLGLLGVLVWANFQPALMPPWLAFVVGALCDLLFGLPLGLNATLLPATVVFVRVVGTRFAERRYALDWLSAAAVIVLFELAQWQLLAVAGIPGPLAPLLVQAATTALAYPAVVALAARIQRRLQVLA